LICKNEFNIYLYLNKILNTNKNINYYKMIPNNNDENIHVNIIDNNNDFIKNNNDNNNDNDNDNDNDNYEQLEFLLKEIEDTRLSDYLLYENYYSNYESQILTKGLDYELNYNVKQLTRICDYYSISKEIKINKLKKDEIINFLLDFEENNANTIIVHKRKQLWYFMNELKNDKFMKKYVIW